MQVQNKFNSANTIYSREDLRKLEYFNKDLSFGISKITIVNLFILCQNCSLFMLSSITLAKTSSCPVVRIENSYNYSGNKGGSGNAGNSA